MTDECLEGVKSQGLFLVPDLLLLPLHHVWNRSNILIFNLLKLQKPEDGLDINTTVIYCQSLREALPSHPRYLRRFLFLREVGFENTSKYQ